MKDEIKIQTITIRRDQYDFIKEYREKKGFCLSKFVKIQLDGWIKFVKELENAKRVR